MPPVNITPSRRPTNGAVVRQNMVSVLIEHWRLDSSAGMNTEQPDKVITTAIVIRQVNTALIPSPHSNTEHVKHCHCPCHYKRITSDKHHHRHHRHHYHGQGYTEHASHAIPQHHASHPTLSGQDALRNTSVAGFAANELGFLAISLALSMLLLLIGYKIGDSVCEYEFLCNHSRGRGHKGSRTRRQIQVAIVDEKQPIYLEDKHYEDPDVVWDVAEPLVARTFNRL